MTFFAVLIFAAAELSAKFCTMQNFSIIQYFTCWKNCTYDAIILYTVSSGPDVVMVLMGTKLDLVKDTPTARQVAANEARGVATSKHMIDAIETSSKEDTNIGKTFKKLAKALKQKYEGLKAMDDHEESVHLATQSVNEKQTGCKC